MVSVYIARQSCLCRASRTPAFIKNTLQWQLETLSLLSSLLSWLSSSLEVYWPWQTSPHVYRYQGIHLKGGQHPPLPRYQDCHLAILPFGNIWQLQNSCQKDTKMMQKKSSLARLSCGNYSAGSGMSRLPHQLRQPLRLQYQELQRSSRKLQKPKNDLLVLVKS